MTEEERLEQIRSEMGQADGRDRIVMTVGILVFVVPLFGVASYLYEQGFWGELACGAVLMMAVTAGRFFGIRYGERRAANAYTYYLWAEGAPCESCKKHQAHIAVCEDNNCLAHPARSTIA